MQAFKAYKDDSRLRGQAAWDAAQDLSRNALKKISLQRVHATYQQFQEDNAWDFWNGGIACAEGCLRLDCIDLQKDNDELGRMWKSAVEEPIPNELWVEKDSRVEQVHHQVCHALHGSCESATDTQLSKKFVDSLHRLIASGVLLQLLASFFSI